MAKPSLLILAAGMGSRYGGLKQLDGLGPHNEVILDYSLYDAALAGFTDVVLVIQKEHQPLFEQNSARRVSGKLNIQYAYQSTMDTPFDTPLSGRKKPFGTAHAVLAAKDVIQGPFGVINADDFYGRDAFSALYRFLSTDREDACMVGYQLGNTLSAHGSVSRGICAVNEGFLSTVQEHKEIMREGGKIVSRQTDGSLSELSPQSVTSLNVWGLQPSFFKPLESGFSSFLRGAGEKDEYQLPTVIDGLIKGEKMKVRVLGTDAKWHGVTYQEDRARMKDELMKMCESGLYPMEL